MAEEYYVIVVGAGLAGEHAAGRCTDAGLTTAVVEHELAGVPASQHPPEPSQRLHRPQRFALLLLDRMEAPAAAPDTTTRRASVLPARSAILAGRPEAFSLRGQHRAPLRAACIDERGAANIRLTPGRARPPRRRPAPAAGRRRGSGASPAVRRAFDDPLALTDRASAQRAGATHSGPHLRLGRSKRVT